MRVLKEPEQQERKKKVLRAALHEYIRTGRPVASESIRARGGLNVSSATIRNVMRELEEEGYLSQAHHSAGRVPTDKAYRFYVDGLMEVARLTVQERQRLDEQMKRYAADLGEMLDRCARALAAISRFSGFVIGPRPDQARLRHLEMVPLENRRALAILVFDGGLLQQRVVGLPEGMEPTELPRMSRLLNRLCRGRSLEESRLNLPDLLREEEMLHRRTLEWTEELGRRALQPGEADVHLDGEDQVLSLPDFADHEEISALAQMFGRRQEMARVLERRVRGSSPAVLLGAEVGPPLPGGLSVVTHTYRTDQGLCGLLGILGPRRMPYPRMMALVEHAAAAATEAIRRFLEPSLSQSRGVRSGGRAAARPLRRRVQDGRN